MEIAGAKPTHQVGAIGGALVGRLAVVQATDVEDEIKRLGRLRRGKHIAILQVTLGTGDLASIARHFQRAINEVNSSCLPALLLENRMLQAELPGYAEHATKVRFRLIPRV